MLAAGARVIMAVKMDGFLFLPRCIRLRIKMWVTAGYAEIGAKPQVTTVTTFREFFLLSTQCWMMCTERSDSPSCNPLGCGSTNALDPDSQEHVDTEQYHSVLSPKRSRGRKEGICWA